MNAPARTKVFGIALPFDPKYLLIGLFALAGITYFLNSGSTSDEAAVSGSTSRRSTPASALPPPALQARARAVRRSAAQDRGILKFKTVDGSDGHIDPTLRLDLLSRLQTVKPIEGGRSLFEIGDAERPNAVPAAVVAMRRSLPPAPHPVQPVQPSAPVQPAVNIPLHFYGFVHPARNSETNRGLFLNGDNVIVAAEGDVIDGRYLIVELTANHARVEDTFMKQGQTLPVVPAGQE